MSKTAKIVLVVVIVGAIAYGVYSYMKKKSASTTAPATPAA